MIYRINLLRVELLFSVITYCIHGWPAPGKIGKVVFFTVL